jgi:hypothetical protein
MKLFRCQGAMLLSVDSETDKARALRIKAAEASRRARETAHKIGEEVQRLKSSQQLLLETLRNPRNEPSRGLVAAQGRSNGTSAGEPKREG